jgi:hypothetical protein
MSLVELYINNKLADITDSIKITLDKVVSEYRNPTKKTGSYSQAFTLPFTANNKAIFFNENDKQIVGKFKKTYEAQLIVNGEAIVTGNFLHLKTTAKGFEGAVGASRIGNPAIADLLLDKKLTDIKSFDKIDYSGNQSIIDSWNTLIAYPDAEVCYPYVVPCFSHLTTGLRSTYENIGVSHFMPAIIKHIFEDAGYEVEGDIFDSATFNKLFLLYSNSDAQKWNYGKLNVMNAGSPFFDLFGTVYAANIIKTIERQSDTIYVVSYPFVTNVGDLSESLGADGVYTCKFSGLYDWRVRGEAQIQIGGFQGAGTGFTAFRCITDDETIPENSIPGSSQFATLTTEYLDNGTIAVGQDTDFTFTARLEEGKQYQLQRYISIPNSTVNGRTDAYAYALTTGKFNILSLDGPLLLNPALFLPDMSQVDLVNAVFKMFNLFYELNEDEKVITLITRDNYFQQSLSSVVDLSNYVNILEMDEYPLTDAEVEATYLSFADDDNDYILKQTNYLELVNGLQPEKATKLPFAPLGFIQHEYNAGGFSTPILGNELLPAIFPDTTSVDTSVLSDEDAISSSSITPRIALYNGADWILPALTGMCVSLGRYHPPTSNFIGGFYPGYYDAVGFAPKLSFFDYASQPVYKITTNTALRSFTVTLSTDDNIYSTADTNFLQDVTRIPDLNGISLATNVDELVNPKGFFYSLYANDLLIANLSNYLEGRGRITPTLFNQLTGRQVLSIQEDLYLLESIKAFDVSGDFATYKLYKLLRRPDADLASTLRYTSTQSYTASCANGYTGSDVTRSATRSSYTSQAVADAAALAGARADAELYLYCALDAPTSWTSTQSYTAQCGGGYYGDDSTATVTYTSTISQLDADTEAYNQAVAEAQANLYCNLIEP